MDIRHMNIRQRLRVSNLLMLVVPAAIAAAVGVAMIAASWYALASGSGIGTDSGKDFFRASDTVAAAAKPLLKRNGIAGLKSASSLASMLDASSMKLVILQQGGAVFSHGDLSTQDDDLLRAAAQTPGDLQLTSDDRCLSARDVSAGGATYRLCILGDAFAGSEALTKGVIVIAAAALLAALALAIALTSRFLTRFVLRHVTDPLDELARATRRIRDGELVVRLPADRTDEFAPVYADFNDMAARLSDSVERDRRIREQRSTLLIGISHDLRSPLTSIQAYAEGLLDGIAGTPEASECYLRMIKGKAEEMGGLLRRLSAVAKADRQVEEADLARLRLDELVGSWIQGNAEAYGLRGVDVDAELEPAEARASGETVARMLGNLFDNCAAYGRTGGGRCRARVSVKRSADGGVLLAVDDDGPGVPEGDLPRLFDLFWRGDAARTALGEGNGIGLAVVALAMERMGGSARAEASPLGGLRVELAFPPVDAVTPAAPREGEDAA